MFDVWSDFSAWWSTKNPAPNGAYVIMLAMVATCFVALAWAKWTERRSMLRSAARYVKQRGIIDDGLPTDEKTYIECEDGRAFEVRSYVPGELTPISTCDEDWIILDECDVYYLGRAIIRRSQWAEFVKTHGVVKVEAPPFDFSHAEDDDTGCRWCRWGDAGDPTCECDDCKQVGKAITGESERA
jgi:hypothetical protein